jgi:uridine kinase
LKELKAEKQFTNLFILCNTQNRRYHYNTPKKVMIVEGILILANPELDLFDIKVLFMLIRMKRLIRRLKRGSRSRYGRGS